MKRAWIVATAMTTIGCSWDWDLFEPTLAAGGSAGANGNAGMPARDAAPDANGSAQVPGECTKERGVTTANSGDTAIEVAHWKFDEQTGTVANDSSGYCYNLTLLDASWVLPGRFDGSALSVDALRRGYAEIDEPVVDTSRSYSVTAWVNVNLERPDQVHTFVSMDGLDRSAFYLQLNFGLFRFKVTSSPEGGNETIVDGLENVASDTWYHVAGVFDGTRIVLYVDGVEQGQRDFLSPWQSEGPTAVGRGQQRGEADDFVTGTIDEVRIFQGILTPQELAAMANP